MNDKESARKLLIEEMKRYPHFNLVFFTDLNGKEHYRKEFIERFDQFMKLVDISINLDKVDECNARLYK